VIVPGALVVEVRIRLGNGIARFAPAPVLSIELPTGATIADLYDRLAVHHPQLAPALQSALPIVAAGTSSATRRSVPATRSRCLPRCPGAR
jgi:hypothetical protein